MSLFVPWLGLPLALGLLSLGCALALERVSRVRVPGALLLPLGLATVIVVAVAATATSATARLATPTVVAVGLIGLILGRREVRRAAGPWLVAAAAVYLIYGAPVLATGAATFTGYIKLDDTATWLGITDHVMSHGRDLHGLAPSTYQAVLAAYLPGGYPLGGFVALGVAREILFTDPMWLYQPFEAYMGAMLAASLYALTRGLLTGSGVRGLVAAVASQPATLYAYSMWGGIKELVAAALLPLVAALADQARRDREHGRGRILLPVAVAASAVLCTLSAGAAIWVFPLVLPAVLGCAGVSLRTAWRALRLRRLIWLLSFGAICSAPVIALAPAFLAPLFATGPGGGGVFTSQVEVGNLLAPLDLLQIVGIWPAGDFRIDPTHLATAHWLILVAIQLGVVGVLCALRARRYGLVAYVLGAVAVCLAILTRGSPWVNAKSLAQASPAILLAALAACGIAWERRRLRALGVLGFGALIAGVLWSNVLAYREVTLAPRDQLLELSRIGDLAAGRGPTLMADFSVIGSRHLLRRAQADTSSELAGRLVPLRNGSLVAPTAHADLDALDQAAVWAYRSLVLRRGPSASRPPTAYSLIWAGRYYELWQRPVGAVRPVLHLPLGGPDSAGAVPSCAEVHRMARLAGAGGRLATVVRDEPTVLVLEQGPLPARWTLAGGAGGVNPAGAGTIDRTVSVASAAGMEVWLAGSMRARVTIGLDGRPVGSVRQQLNWPGGFTPFGVVGLSRGTHRLSLHYDDGGFAPGNVGQEVHPYGFGPVILGDQTAALPVLVVRAAQASTLCGRRLDWIEALPPA